MLKEALSEICAEIRLLSQYASSFDTQQTLSVDNDVTMLFSGLCLLSTHAERLMETDKDLVALNVDRDWTPNELVEVEDEPEHDGEAQLGAQHGWIADVVKDLALYARQNNMDQLSGQLDDVLDSVFHELHFRDLETTVAATANASGNVIPFAAQAGQRKLQSI